jgi:A/G-specific adenine glycosylase
LLKWYDTHGRDLPWRIHDGRAETPYHTWLAEIMLQQTGVSTVIPYYERFHQTLADRQKTGCRKRRRSHAGMGGPRLLFPRAQFAEMRTVVAEHHGANFRQELDELLSLPGIGPYTANAIRAIAFDKPANVVDGNVERVMARLFAYLKASNTPQGKKDLTALAATLAPTKRAAITPKA